MKKILIIGPFPEPISGVALANKVVKEVLDKALDFDVKVINTSYPIFEDAIGSFSFKKLLFFLGLNFKYLKILKKDIVYITPGQTFFGISKYTFLILFSWLLRKELIIHVHGNYLGTQYEILKGIKKKLFYFLISRFTKGIVLSDSLKPNLTPFLNSSNIFVVPNFAEDYLCKSNNRGFNNKLNIVFLSNLMEEKGILYLLESLKKLEEKNINYEAKIAGNIDSLLIETITSKIKKLKHTSYIGVVYREEKRKLLEWGNIFVLPTFYKMEGQPISILEALATQNVIIATNHAGIPDIIKNSINGFIIETKNSNSIFEVLLYLDKNKQVIKDISDFNKNYFTENFTLRTFSNNIINVLNANTRTKNI